MATGRSYKDLIAWQKAMDLMEGVYRAADEWPKRETYGLTDQVRRAVVSIPANIAEGQGRTGRKEFLHHLSIANGSLYEAETHLLIAQRLRYIEERVCDALLRQITEMDRLLHGLIRSLQAPS